MKVSILSVSSVKNGKFQIKVTSKRARFFTPYHRNFKKIFFNCKQIFQEIPQIIVISMSNFWNKNHKSTLLTMFSSMLKMVLLLDHD